MNPVNWKEGFPSIDRAWQYFIVLMKTQGVVIEMNAKYVYDHERKQSLWYVDPICKEIAPWVFPSEVIAWREMSESEKKDIMNE